jgi:nicotinamidase-related amidase
VTAWLVVIAMQVVFAEEGSPWASPQYAAAEPVVQRLVEAFGENVVFTRFVAPEHPEGAWKPYYELWPFALVPPDDRLYDLMPAFEGAARHVVTAPTFGKWGDELAGLLGPDATMYLVGVSTDCCVISTALPASDAGVAVKVVADGCAGLSPEDHQRALYAMALYAPLIEITSADEVLAAL